MKEKDTEKQLKALEEAVRQEQELRKLGYPTLLVKT